MENLDKYTTKDFANLIESLVSDVIKIEDILFDKAVILAIKDKKKVLVEEKGVSIASIKIALVLLDVNKQGTLLGIQWTKGNKKPYKLVQVAKLAGSRFVLEEAIDSKSFSEKEIKGVLDETIPDLKEMKATDEGLRALTSTPGLPRTTNEILGILHFEHGIPASTINKALSKLPEEITRNPITTLLRINSFVYSQGLNAWLSHSPNIIKEVGYISQLRNHEQQQVANVFQGALGMIDDQERRNLAAYVFTAHPDKITKLSGLLEDIFKFTQPHGQGNKNRP